MKIKYSHLSSQKLKSSYTKSKNLHIYLYFIDFSDPSQIPFIDVARVTGEKPAKIRGMMKNAWNNDKISLGLVDVGVDPADIPEWFARPRRLKLRSKRPAVNKLPARVPTEPRTLPIQVAKKYIIPGSQSFNAQPITRYGPNFYEPRNTPETDEVWRLITRNIQKQTALDLEEHLDEQKSRKTLRERIAERKAWIAQQEMERSARAQRQRDRFTQILIYQDLTRKRVTREDVEALEHGFQQVMKVTSQILTRQPNKKRKVDTTPLLSQNPFKDLQERIDALNNQPVYTSENLNALKTLFEDNRERNQQKKITRQGYSLNPIVNLFPHLTPIVEIDPRKRRKKKR